jgi:hypothetical protein
MTERLIYEAPESIDEFHCSADGGAWLAVLPAPMGRFKAVFNGEDAGTYDSIQHATVSPDGRIAFKAEESRKQFVVLDGKPGTGFLEVDEPRFGPRGLFYRAELFGKQFVVEGDVEGSRYDEISGLTLAPDGRLACAARTGKEWFVVVGGEEKARYDRVGRPVFGADGARLAYAASRKGRSFVVLDETPQAEFDSVQEPVLAADGPRYVGIRDERAYVVLGDQELGPFDKAETPDAGPRPFFVFERGGAQWIWNAGAELGPYPVVAYPALGPDGRLHFVTESSGRRVLSIDGKISSEPFDEILDVSIDAHGVAFSARLARQRFMVIAGARHPSYDMVADFRWMPGGTCYRAKQGRQWRVVVGSETGPLYDSVRILRTSPLLVYSALRGRQAWRVEPADRA